MQKRSVGCTVLNEQSSRSHMVFTLRLEGENVATDKKSLGVLNLIDLAGSERVKESGSTGIRLKEAQAINTSLSALGEKK
jgi:kinesin family protein C1